MLHVDVHDAGGIFHRVLSIAEGERQSVSGVNLGRLLLSILALLPIPVLNRHLAELPCEGRRALTLVPGAALSTIHAGKMAYHYSEVGGSEGVRGMAVLTDDGGGVAQLTVVLAPPPCAGHLADGGCEDHLDPSRVVPHVDGVVSHCQGNGSVRLMLDMCLGVCGLCVVVLGLPDKLLDTRLDLLGPDQVGGLLDGQGHLGHVADRDWRRGITLLGDGPLGNGPLGHYAVSIGVAVPWLRWVGGGGHGVLFTCLALGARLADTELGPQTHSSILALGQTVGLCAPLRSRGLTPSVTALPSTDIHP